MEVAGRIGKTSQLHAQLPSSFSQLDRIGKVLTGGLLIINDK
jgi:hypothetical protein